MSIEFWLTSLVIVATPGTGVLYTLGAGLSRGARASLVAAAGCTLGIVPHLAAALTGLAALLHASGVAFSIVKYLGVAYLLYLAWSTLRETGTLSVDRVTAARGREALRVLIVYTIGFAAFTTRPPVSSGTDPHPRTGELRGNFASGLGWLLAGITAPERVA